ncbi:MAG: PspC domain-containing protein, partial [Actinomycetota bacterium]|nr:PspC domain-containing protein [Actinomycetota bacterium]
MSTSAEQEAGITAALQPVREQPAVPAPASDGTGSPLRRHRSGRVIAGVSSGIAEHLGVPVLWVRVIFAVP